MSPGESHLSVLRTTSKAFVVSFMSRRSVQLQSLAPPCLLICVTVRSNVLFFFACCRSRRWQCMLRDVTILVQKHHRHAFNPSYQAQLAFSRYLFMTEM